MDSTARDDIRRLLKTFGIQADEEIITHLARMPGLASLRVRLSLTDLTDYGSEPPKVPLKFELEGEIRR